MNSVRSLIVVGGLTAGVIGGSWAWTVSHAAPADDALVANGIEQSVVGQKPSIVSTIKKNKSLNLPAMYAAVPLSRSHATITSTRAPEPPSTSATGSSINMPIEVVLPTDEVTTKQIQVDSVLDHISENKAQAAAVYTSSSEEESVVATEIQEDLVTNATASVDKKRPVDYGRLNQRLIQVADALERLNLRLAAMAAKDNKDQAEADAPNASTVAPDMVELVEG